VDRQLNKFSKIFSSQGGLDSSTRGERRQIGSISNLSS
jgi:hypothetical protein